jgi:hypothetical protein
VRLLPLVSGRPPRLPACDPFRPNPWNAGRRPPFGFHANRTRKIPPAMPVSGNFRKISRYPPLTLLRDAPGGAGPARRELPVASGRSLSVRTAARSARRWSARSARRWVGTRLGPPHRVRLAGRVPRCWLGMPCADSAGGEARGAAPWRSSLSQVLPATCVGRCSEQAAPLGLERGHPLPRPARPGRPGPYPRVGYHD